MEVMESRIPVHVIFGLMLASENDPFMLLVMAIAVSMLYIFIYAIRYVKTFAFEIFLCINTWS